MISVSLLLLSLIIVVSAVTVTKRSLNLFFPYHDFYSQKSKNLIQVLSIHLNGWKLDKKLGGIIMLSYASFLVLSILVETNVFFPVNLPTCVVH